MKAILLNANITSITAKVDGSLGLRLNTAELKPEEKTLFFQLQNLNLKLSMTPIDEEKPEEVKIDTELNQKSQSTRIRNVLFILWKQNPEGMEFEAYYKNKTEKYIESLKARIEE